MQWTLRYQFSIFIKVFQNTPKDIRNTLLAHFVKINHSITVKTWPKVTKVEPRIAPFYFIKMHKSANLTKWADLGKVQFFTILLAIKMGNFWHVSLFCARLCCMSNFQKTIFSLHKKMVFAKLFVERTILEKNTCYENCSYTNREENCQQKFPHLVRVVRQTGRTGRTKCRICTYMLYFITID